MIATALGEPELFRLWCSACDRPPNEMRRVDFHGWLVGWGDAASRQSRTEVSVFLTAEGEVLCAVDVQADARPRVVDHPPDLWSTFVARHEGLGQAEAWLHDLERNASPDVDEGAVDLALAQARRAIHSGGS